MISDTERRAVARRLRGIKDTREGGSDMCCDLWVAIFDSDYRCTGLCDECEVAVLDSLADLIEPPYPDATASYKGWRVEVYDPDGVLVSPSNVAADLVRAHADLTDPDTTTDTTKTPELTTKCDRDVLLKLAYLLQAMGEKSDEKGRYDLGITFTSIADRIREALGVEP